MRQQKERGAENEEIGRCWVGAWVGGEWRNWSLQREEMKSVRIEGREEQRVKMGKEEKEKNKIKYSNHQCEHDKFFFCLSYSAQPSLAVHCS